MTGAHRWLIALALVVSLAAPSASALYQAVDHGRVRALWTADYEDGNGTTHTGITGDGVVLFSMEGYDGTHPDLDQCASWEQHQINSLEETGTLYGPRNDQGGHGNHVAGIVCGDGEMSDGEVKGVAWESTLVSTHSGCAEACEENDYMTKFPFRILTSSVGCDVIHQAEAWGLPENASVLFVQAEGNDGGNGSTAQTCSAKRSDPRFMGIAASVGREAMAEYSSRGDQDDPSTWPSITAPGCMFSVVPPPWVEIYALSVYYTVGAEVVASPPRCPEASAETFARLHALGYARAYGTSMATPFVAGVAGLMYEVNPDLPVLDAKFLITRTADAFLATNDTNANGRIEPVEFYQQHGYKAGWGLVNATAAVAAANYADLHPNASMQEAIACSTTGNTTDGRLVLNPGGGTCPAWFSPETKQADTPEDEAVPAKNQIPANASEEASNASENATSPSEPSTNETPAFPSLWIPLLTAASAALLAPRSRSQP